MYLNRVGLVTLDGGEWGEREFVHTRKGRVLGVRVWGTEAQAARELMHHVLRHEAEFVAHFRGPEVPLAVVREWLEGQEHPRQGGTDAA